MGYRPYQILTLLYLWNRYPLQLLPIELKGPDGPLRQALFKSYRPCPPPPVQHAIPTTCFVSQALLTPALSWCSVPGHRNSLCVVIRFLTAFDLKEAIVLAGMLLARL